MIKEELFKEENIGLLSPYSFEFVNHLIGQLGYSQDQYDDTNVKEEVLKVLKLLFELKILRVFDWMNNPELNNKIMSAEDTIKHIDDKWFVGIKYPDFYDIVMIGTQDWYINNLELLGMSHTTNWNTFVKEKIGNLELWIENNRPK